MIVPRYYEDLSVLHDNTMPARAYYMPASKRMDDLVEHRELSDRMQLLNGTWKFQYFDSIYDMKDAFYEDGYLVEGFDEKGDGLLTGRLSNNILVHFPGCAEMVGKILNVKLVECKGFYYMGELAE